MNVYRIDKCPRCAASLTPRSTDQNARLHAMIGDIAKQKQWAGQWVSVEDWKRLFIAAFCRANGNPPAILPAIDGSGIEMVYRRSSRMSKQEMSELIEYVTSWALDNNIQLQEAA